MLLTCRSIDLVAKNTGSLCEAFRSRHESLFIFHALENQTRAFPTVSRNNIHQKIKLYQPCRTARHLKRCLSPRSQPLSWPKRLKIILPQLFSQKPYRWNIIIYRHFEVRSFSVFFMALVDFFIKKYYINVYFIK